MEGIEALVNLQILELGSNRIREICGLKALVRLQELWLGKNKLASFDGLPPLPELHTLDLKSNRFTAWGSQLFNLSHLEKLYMSHNGLPDLPPDLEKLSKLQLLDVAANPIAAVPKCSNLTELNELWLNDTQISTLEEVDNLSCYPSLKCIFLERTPVWTRNRGALARAVLTAVPTIEEMDFTLMKENQAQPYEIDANGPKSILKGSQARVRYTTPSAPVPDGHEMLPD